MTIRALIVDDSALMRDLLSTMLNADPEIEVVGTAGDPYQAREAIKKLNPDVITLDVEMPRMDGLSFLEKIMTLRPMPVVMVSSLTQRGAEVTIRALELGAVDYFAKPTVDLVRGIEKRALELTDKVKMAARAQVRALQHKPFGEETKARKLTFKTTEKVVAIGSSTGGVEALRQVIAPLPANCPAMLVTQHMPPGFTATFAQRLNTLTAATVKEAVDGERVLPGHVYIAPGAHHLRMARSGANYLCRLDDGPPVTGHKPSVDVLFNSFAEVVGENGIGVILTGMGKDGAEGLLAMRKTGAATIGQDEASCIVYGMPKAAFEAGAVEEQFDLTKIAEAILARCGGARQRDMRV